MATEGDDEPMVSASVIHRELGIPPSTLLRLVKAGQLPAHEVTQPWHRNRRWLFKVSEVRAALEKPRPLA
jgi:predicted site-specific integrase-resolvase